MPEQQESKSGGCIFTLLIIMAMVIFIPNLLAFGPMAFIGLLILAIPVAVFLAFLHGE